MTVAPPVLFLPGQGPRESARTRQGRMMKEDGPCPLPPGESLAAHWSALGMPPWSIPPHTRPASRAAEREGEGPRNSILRVGIETPMRALQTFPPGINKSVA